jgi:hypothetical protein
MAAIFCQVSLRADAFFAKHEKINAHNPDYMVTLISAIDWFRV